MKYRIVKFGDEYKVQVKEWLFWVYLEEMKEVLSLVSDGRPHGYQIIRRDTLEEAKECIKQYKKFQRKKNPKIEIVYEEEEDEDYPKYGSKSFPKF